MNLLAVFGMASTSAVRTRGAPSELNSAFSMQGKGWQRSVNKLDFGRSLLGKGWLGQIALGPRSTVGAATCCEL